MFDLGGALPSVGVHSQLVIAVQQLRRPSTRYQEDREIAISIITIAKLEMGVLAAASPRIRAARLQTLRDAEQLTVGSTGRSHRRISVGLVVRKLSPGAK